MEYDTKRYKVYTWKNWILLHWIINPGLAVNELIFGQRVPKISLVDRTLDKPKLERSFVPCPHCETLHDGRTWSTQNGTGLKNWFGLYCPKCGGVIPCITNGLSFVILLLTYPIRAPFIAKAKASWLRKQPHRFSDVDPDSVKNPFGRKNWVYTGLGWGFLMFFLMEIIFPMLQLEVGGFRSLLSGLVVWSISGLVFGYSMKLYFGYRPS